MIWIPVCIVGYFLLFWFVLGLCWAAAEADKKLGLK